MARAVIAIIAADVWNSPLAAVIKPANARPIRVAHTVRLHLSPASQSIGNIKTPQRRRSKAFATLKKFNEKMADRPVCGFT
jgi:hypothetical protein